MSHFFGLGFRRQWAHWNMVEGDQEPADPRSGTSKDSGIHHLIEVTLW